MKKAAWFIINKRRSSRRRRINFCLTRTEITLLIRFLTCLRHLSSCNQISNIAWGVELSFLISSSSSVSPDWLNHITRFLYSDITELIIHLMKWSNLRGIACMIILRTRDISLWQRGQRLRARSLLFSYLISGFALTFYQAKEDQTKNSDYQDQYNYFENNRILLISWFIIFKIFYFSNRWNSSFSRSIWVIIVWPLDAFLASSGGRLFISIAYSRKQLQLKQLLVHFRQFFWHKQEETQTRRTPLATTKNQCKSKLAF